MVLLPLSLLAPNPLFPGDTEGKNPTLHTCPHESSFQARVREILTIINSHERFLRHRGVRSTAGLWSFLCNLAKGTISTDKIKTKRELSPPRSCNSRGTKCDSLPPSTLHPQEVQSTSGDHQPYSFKEFTESIYIQKTSLGSYVGSQT